MKSFFQSCYLILVLVLASLGSDPAAAQAARNPADLNKVLRVAFPVAESGFDPVRVNDLYSNTVTAAIFQSLVTYDWLARPNRVVPDAAEALPEVSDNGTLYTFRIRPGLYFAPHPVFKGKRREVVAQDFVYTLLRHADPQSRSPQFSDLVDRIVGFEASHKAASQPGARFDYDRPHPGVYASDRYTLHIRLRRPDRNLLTLLTNPYAGAMAREVVEHFGFEDTMTNPVGSGPYMIDRWVRGSKIILKANPEYPGFIWNFQPTPGDAAQARVAAQMRGRKMPQIGRVEISIIEEPQSLWLAFSSQQLDVLGIPPAFIEKALDAQNRLLPEWETKGAGIFRSVEPDIRYQFFNMRDPVIGGMSKEKIALRRAIIMAYDIEEEIRVIRKGQAIAAQQMVSPVIPGHDPDYVSINRFDPPLANALLDRFGYKKGADGWRTHPDGKPLIFTLYSSTSSVDRERDELWKRSLDRIGVRLEVRKDKFPEMLKQGKQCAISSWGLGWTRSADAEYVMKILSSGTIGQNNYACFENADYDRHFEELKRLPDGPERTRALRNMYRLIEVYGVVAPGSTSIATRIHHARVEGYSKHPLLLSEWQYLDVRKP